ncbi:DUF6232 family protein [Streptomyces sp. ZAF1911]|uniref:DUF6232 family protein n=1 Tax=Streptomyces sp. ZAF1911 TaxID=2944129 RepID=UPI00237BB585|nr:DUF6232 family protein [Streptomyces sp. ZAF1911]MDD9378107.1 DUF6232 family protein [Streptomyces sp. ZAF1911]
MPAPTLPAKRNRPEEFGAPDLVLRVSNRLLWVGEAVYPLHNIVRVQTFVLTPDRKKAMADFAPWIILVLVFFVTSLVDGNPLGIVATIVPMALLVAYLVRRLTRPDLYVMGVETSGAPVAVVTLADRAELRRLVARIVDAIEHPETEFSLYVAQPTVNIGHYVHVGDTANINGGSGNIGVMKK